MVDAMWITVAQQELDSLKGHGGKVLVLSEDVSGGVSLHVANGERLVVFRMYQVEEPPALTPVKDIHVGDVIQTGGDKKWNRAIVSEVNVRSNYVYIYRPHLHMDPADFLHIPYIRYKQHRTYGPQVVIHE